MVEGEIPMTGSLCNSFSPASSLLGSWALVHLQCLSVQLGQISEPTLGHVVLELGLAWILGPIHTLLVSCLILVQYSDCTTENNSLGQVVFKCSKFMTVEYKLLFMLQVYIAFSLFKRLFLLNWRNRPPELIPRS